MSRDKESKCEREGTTDLPQDGEAAREATTSEYEVGYGKPPKSTRFQPGQSGNPRGRPKGTKNLKTDLIEELHETIEIREGNRTRKVTKQRAFVKALTNGSIKGNARSAGLLLSTMLRVLDTGANDIEASDEITADEAEILREFEARLRRRAVASTTAADEQGSKPLSGES
ncbi:MAG: hypothetical protein IPK00_18265 [Deltaproteobacteria bacterium]|nr:hypothetical protein [Deltaproteobacteria bacterium]